MQLYVPNGVLAPGELVEAEVTVLLPPQQLQRQPPQLVRLEELHEQFSVGADAADDALPAGIVRRGDEATEARPRVKAPDEGQRGDDRRLERSNSIGFNDHPEKGLPNQCNGAKIRVNAVNKYQNFLQHVSQLHVIQDVIQEI